LTSLGSRANRKVDHLGTTFPVRRAGLDYGVPHCQDSFRASLSYDPVPS